LNTGWGTDRSKAKYTSAIANKMTPIYKSIHKYSVNTEHNINMNYEYKYFRVFAKQACLAYGVEVVVHMLQLHTHALDVVDTLLDKGHDTDTVQSKCGDLVGLMYGITIHMNNIDPTPPCDAPSTEHWTHREKALHLIATVKKFALTVMKIRYNGMFHLLPELEGLAQDIVYVAWSISKLSTLHELMSCKIQSHCHYHLIMDKQHTIQSKPYLKFHYENYPIYPWKYNFQAGSKSLIEFIGECHSISLEQLYSLDEVTTILQNQIFHKIHEHNLEEEFVIETLEHIFQIERSNFNIRDKRSLQWPILLHLYIPSFETI